MTCAPPFTNAVAAEVEDDEAAGLEVARVVGDLEVADAVEAEPEAGEACIRAGEDIRTCTGDASDSSPGMQVKGERRTRAVAEADGEAVRVVGLHAAREAEGAEGGGGEEVRGEALHAVLRDLVFGEVEVLERVEGVEQLGERVEVGAAGV